MHFRSWGIVFQTLVALPEKDLQRAACFLNLGGISRRVSELLSDLCCPAFFSLDARYLGLAVCKTL